MSTFKESRWPKVLRVLTETDPPAKGVEVYTLAANAAYCTVCGWKGPLRETSMEALQDRAQHLDEAVGVAWHQVAYERSLQKQKTKR